jgi:flagellar hook-basal body complex protein FliE
MSSMSSSINGLGIPMPPTAPAASPVASGPASAGDAPLFGDLLIKSLSQVNGLEQSAHAAVERSFVDDDLTQIEAMTAMKKADLAMRLMIQVRNKIMDAYSEIKQMQM